MTRPLAVFDIEADLAAIPIARHRVCAALGGLGASEIEDAALMTSEVLANAVEHATTETIAVRVLRSGKVVRVEVEDQDGREPERAPPNATASRGRGFFILDAYAADWGVEPIPGNGKVVWFEFRTA